MLPPEWRRIWFILSECYVRVLAGRWPKIAQCLLSGGAASGIGETMKYDPGRLVGVKHPRVLQFYPPPKHCRAVYNTLRKGYTTLGSYSGYHQFQSELGPRWMSHLCARHLKENLMTAGGLLSVQSDQTTPTQSCWPWWAVFFFPLINK